MNEAFTTSVQAMPVAPVHEPDGMTTQVAAGCGVGRIRVVVSAWPEAPNGKSAGAPFGVHGTSAVVGFFG